MSDREMASANHNSRGCSIDSAISILGTPDIEIYYVFAALLSLSLLLRNDIISSLESLDSS